MRWFRYLLEWVLPEKLRDRPTMPEKSALAAFANMDEGSAQYRALMRAMHDQFAVEVQTLLSNRLNGEERAFQAGRAASLHFMLLRIEQERREAHELAEAAQKKTRPREAHK